MLVPLDHVLLNYPLSDYKIMFFWNEFSFIRWVAILTSLISIYFYLNKVKINLKHFGLIMFIIGIIVFILPNGTTPHPNRFKSSIAEYIAVNKLSYFFTKIKNNLSLNKNLTHQEIKTLAKAVNIDIPDDLIPEVAFSLNGLLEALNQTGVEGLETVEPLPIVIPSTS